MAVPAIPYTNLEALVNATKPGDTLTLQPGTYPPSYLRKIARSPAVTITGTGVVIQGLTLQGSSGLIFRGLEFITAPGKSTGMLADIQAGCSNVTFDGCKLHGAAISDGNGITARGSGMTITGCEFYNLAVAIQHIGCTGLVIKNNHIHDIQGDGIKGSGFQNVTIDGNLISDFYPNAGDHPDGIQAFTAGTTAAASGLTITNNQILRGKGQPFQGIFIGNELGLSYANVTIDGNVVTSGMWHGISIYDAVSPVVTNNFVQGQTDAVSGGQVMTPWILLDHCTGGTVAFNTSAAVTLTSTTGVTPAGTVAVKNAAPGDLSAMTAFLAKASGGVSSPPSTPPPAVDLLQGQLDDANATIATLKATNASLSDQLAAANATVATLTAQRAAAAKAMGFTP